MVGPRVIVISASGPNLDRKRFAARIKNEVPQAKLIGKIPAASSDERTWNLIMNKLVIKDGERLVLSNVGNALYEATKVLQLRRDQSDDTVAALMTKHIEQFRMIYVGTLQNSNYTGRINYNERNFQLELHRGTERQLHLQRKQKDFKKKHNGITSLKCEMSKKEIAEVNLAALKSFVYKPFLFSCEGINWMTVEMPLAATNEEKSNATGIVVNVKGNTQVWVFKSSLPKCRCPCGAPLQVKKAEKLGSSVLHHFYYQCPRVVASQPFMKCRYYAYIKAHIL